MTDNEKVIRTIMEAIEDLNEQLPREEKIEKSINTTLFGSGGKLDSLGLISLVTTVEQKIEEDFGMTVTLLDDIAGLEHKNPFLTVKTLSDYVTSVLETKRFE
jgi:acyl carrier protein